ncbi:glycosyltransferase family 2 protein [Haliscomenobacter hydrossis]|uniref:Glycosyl transferase family 2 n=1 Tax=Haliscomenobacter hydrossis (strain ATCC 27775 / DSM 1100 / LMG 10767 / O) TaxID=760192 RepID=F4L0A9_HALH1|nr:glycosyltransferase family 2 protein [Haliscomenobacter hydrossis]AEE53782.1 glycosyl transferase family 2 [Haliscomenobacter hydrossis DSM 1100]
MLSILIPIYNYDVRHLVGELHRQAEELNLTYEICLLDDASSLVFQQRNRELAQKTNVRYEELSQNIGRSAIRNRLVTIARYDYLLFMDCDSGVVMPHYLQTYLQHLQPNRLLYGGRTYLPKPPSDRNYLLHWHYGRQREQQDFASRQIEPYHSFMTNNFLIPSQVFASITFNEQIRTYGHEDTLFGMELAKKGVEILHLNNPLLHLGLETNLVFLQKTEMAVLNLARLHREKQPVHTRLSKIYHTLNKWGLTLPVGFLLRPMRSLFVAELTRRARPNLRYLDLYKLSFFIDAMRA